jgi:hypothetical protein
MSSQTSIVSTGIYLPERVLTNAELEKMVDTTDEWILSRTGIRERRIAAKDELTSDMGARAAEQAIQSAGLDPKSIDLIIVATCTPDNAFPSTACYIQHKIGATRAAAFDIQAACSGFLYALVTADQFLSGGVTRPSLSSARKSSLPSSTGRTATLASSSVTARARCFCNGSPVRAVSSPTTSARTARRPKSSLFPPAAVACRSRQRRSPGSSSISRCRARKSSSTPSRR